MINSFVYTARRPFSPAKLYELVHDKFVILEPQEDEGESGDEEHENLNDDASSAASPTSSPSDSGIAIEDSSSDDVDSKAASPLLQHDYPDVPLHKRLANKKAHPIFKTLTRSKGFIWLATRPSVSGNWSQAGAMLKVSAGLNWFCVQPGDEWGTDTEEVRALIRKDFVGEWGDRRQEVVLLGRSLMLRGLSECLVRVC